MMSKYQKYKTDWAKNIKFNKNKPTQSKQYKFCLILILFFILASTVEFAPLQLILIYFDTSTYDEIERDVKMTLTGQIGLIGGTMGLLTGFSILSGVEILYFAAKLIMSLRIPQGVLAKPRKVGNHLYQKMIYPHLCFAHPNTNKNFKLKFYLKHYKLITHMDGQD